MVDPVMFASNGPCARTPPEVFAPLHAAFDFQVDLAASDEDHLLPAYVTQEQNALSLPDWGGARVYCNPPWGKRVRPRLHAWVRRFRVEASERGALVVALLPGRVDTQWWHDDVMGWADVLLVRGRVTFLRPDGTPHDSPAPFPVAVASWEPGCKFDPAGKKIHSWNPYERKIRK